MVLFLTRTEGRIDRFVYARPLGDPILRYVVGDTAFAVKIQSRNLSNIKRAYLGFRAFQ